MAAEFILVDPRAVDEGATYPDSDEGFIFEHLRRYCAKFDPLPAITVSVVQQRLVTTRGHIYLRIAKDLGRTAIRALVLTPVPGSVPGIIGRVPDEQLRQEQAAKVIDGWHVVFFESAVGDQLLKEIRARLYKLLREAPSSAFDGKPPVVTEWRYDPVGPCLEIRFPTPVADMNWIRLYRDMWVGISKELSPVVSYQGRRFVEG